MSEVERLKKSGKENFRDWAEQVMRIAMKYPHMSYNNLVENGLVKSWMEYMLS